jgi:hypothetical protein
MIRSCVLLDAGAFPAKPQEPKRVLCFSARTGDLVDAWQAMLWIKEEV